MTALIGTSLPLQGIHYFLPIYLVLYLSSKRNRRISFRYAACVGVVIATGLVQVANLGKPGNIPGLLLSTVTFGSLFLLVACSALRLTRDEATACLLALRRPLSLFVIIQSLIAILLRVLTGNPDAASGTFDGSVFLGSAPSIGQVMFGACISGILLLLYLVPKDRLSIGALVAGSAALLISHSIHALIFSIGAVVLATLLTRLQPVPLAQAVATSTFILVVASTVLPRLPTTAASWWDRTVTDPRSPRRMLLASYEPLINDSPSVFVAGLGGGQVSSRAALISSGEYTSVAIPPWLEGQSNSYANISRPAIERFNIMGEGSAISKPYSTWTSILFEFGAFAAIAVAALLILPVVRGMIRNKDMVGRPSYVTTTSAAMAIYLLSLFSIENYAEFPQAVTVPILILTIAAGCRGRHAQGGVAFVLPNSDPLPPRNS